MMERIAFSQLWIEEEDFLRTLAQGLPEGSTYVEIGTAQGGSAYIFGQEAAQKRLEIHSFDVAPAEETRKNLKGLSVNLHAMASTEGAKGWSSGPIDLLFIDGGHTFLDAYDDFFHWAGHLRSGGLVLFHDFDRPERGGVVHLGVRLFCETLLRHGCLANVVHEGRILAGRVTDLPGAMPSPGAFAETWRQWGEKMVRVISMKGSSLIGDPASGKVQFVRNLLGASIAPSFSGKEGSPTLYMERPFSDIAVEKSRNGQSDMVLVDDWTLCYLLQDALENHRDLLLDSVSERSVLFKYNELIEMLFHSAGFPQSVQDAFSGVENEPERLSARCAREMVRLHFLEKIAEVLVSPSEDE